MTDKTLTTGDLAQFTGSTTAYRHRMFPGFVYTEGIQYLAQRAGAYWLIDAVFSHQIDSAAKREAFQVWTLTRTPQGGASLVMTDGNDSPPIIRQDIEYTDFPLPEIMLWLIDKTLLLPSEY